MVMLSTVTLSLTLVLLSPVVFNRDSTLAGTILVHRSGKGSLFLVPEIIIASLQLFSWIRLGETWNEAFMLNADDEPSLLRHRWIRGIPLTHKPNAPFSNRWSNCKDVLRLITQQSTLNLWCGRYKLHYQATLTNVLRFRFRQLSVL